MKKAYNLLILTLILLNGAWSQEVDDLKKYGFKCFKSYSELDGAKNRPYYVIKNVRNVKRSNPKDCSLILKEKYNYILSKQEINLGSLWYCD